MFWVDWLIVLLVILGLWQGFWRGLMAQFFQVISIILAMVVAFWAFVPVGNWFEHSLMIPVSYSRPVALAAVFFSATFVLQFIANILQKLVAPLLQASPLNRLGGSLLGATRQVVNVSILLALVVSLPLPAVIKTNVDNAQLAKPLIRLALGLERAFGSVFHDDSLKALSYRIVGTHEQATTALNFTEVNPNVDEAGEVKMLALTNATRVKEKKAPLLPNDKLREVARNHARDMLAKGYFSHISPQGKDALTRVQEAGITVIAVGENLAEAPTPEIAQVGLYASEGHRKNMLNSEFNEVGIGVLDAGKHGKMIVEVFGKLY